MKKIFVVLFLLLAVNLFAQQDTAAVKKVKYPVGYEAKIDAVYIEINDW